MTESSEIHQPRNSILRGQNIRDLVQSHPKWTVVVDWSNMGIDVIFDGTPKVYRLESSADFPMAGPKIYQDGERIILADLEYHWSPVMKSLEQMLLMVQQYATGQVGPIWKI